MDTFADCFLPFLPVPAFEPLLAVERLLTQAESNMLKQSNRLQAGLLVAEVLSVERHPKADRLQLVILNVGHSPVRVRRVFLHTVLHYLWRVIPRLLTVVRHVCRWSPARQTCCRA